MTVGTGGDPNDCDELQCVELPEMGGDIAPPVSQVAVEEKEKEGELPVVRMPTKPNIPVGGKLVLDEQALSSVPLQNRYQSTGEENMHVVATNFGGSVASDERSQAPSTPSKRPGVASKRNRSNQRGSVPMIIRQTVTKGFRAFASRMSSVAHHLMGLDEASSHDLPAVDVPSGKELATRRLDDTTILQVRRAVQANEGGCMARFLASSLKCSDFETHQWSYHPKGVHVGHMAYVMPTPKDIPDSARRIVTIPAEVQCTTNIWIKAESDQALVMLTRTKTEGVMYSDRMHLEYVYEFKVDGQGGLTARFWAQTVWTKPLPWTHSWIAKALDKKVLSDSTSGYDNFIEQLQAVIEEEAAARAAIG